VPDDTQCPLRDTRGLIDEAPDQVIPRLLKFFAQ
jgi:hypothetical protein